MKRLMEETVSAWMDDAPSPTRPALGRDLSVDVCIVGAGMAGLMTAYLLAREGRRVAVLDAQHVGAGQTQRTTAHLTTFHDDFYSELEKVHGREGSRHAAESLTAALNTIEWLVREHDIDCDFERLPGYLFCAPGHSSDVLVREMAAAQRAGLQGLELCERAPLTDFVTGRCLKFPEQAQFHPLKFLTRLAEEVEALGGRIFEHTVVEQVEGGRRALAVTQRGASVIASQVVVATNTPFNDRFAIHTKQAPYLTYVIGVRMPRNSIPRMLLWDTQEYYHYLRVQPWDEESDLLIVGGEDHKAGQVMDQDERHGRLESWTRQRFERLGEVVFAWSGMVQETIDGVAFIGRNPGDESNVFIATGDSGMGMTHGAIAGLLLTDLIHGRRNPWSELYDPSRKPVSGMAWRHFVSENANVGREYVQDWISPGDSPSVGRLGLDEGTVERSGISKVAVYRDPEGQLHRCSAVCPHLGCIVHWNKLEKVWDCPCHGSRFDAYGGVIHGPSKSGLSTVDGNHRSREPEHSAYGG